MWLVLARADDERRLRAVEVKKFDDPMLGGAGSSLI